MQKDICAMIQVFHLNGKILASRWATTSFLAFIPRRSIPNHFQNIVLFVLLNVYIYKLISKLLAVQLKKVLSKVISSCQTSFLPNRQICDGVVAVNDVMDLLK